MTGVVKTLNKNGFGFISREGQVKDLFFHSTDLQGVSFDELKEGDKVTFTIEEGQKGPAAKGVSRI